MARHELMVGSFLVGPVERFFIVRRHTEAWLTEDQMRAYLADEGLPEEEIELQSPGSAIPSQRCPMCQRH